MPGTLEEPGVRQGPQAQSEEPEGSRVIEKPAAALQPGESQPEAGVRPGMRPEEAARRVGAAVPPGLGEQPEEAEVQRVEAVQPGLEVQP